MVLCVAIQVTVDLGSSPYYVDSESSHSSNCVQATYMQQNMESEGAGASGSEQPPTCFPNDSLLFPSSTLSALKVINAPVAPHSHLLKSRTQMDSDWTQLGIPHGLERAVSEEQNPNQSPCLYGELHATKGHVHPGHSAEWMLGRFPTTGSKQKKRAPLSTERRKETANARKSPHRCFRCRKLKRRCDLHQVGTPYEPCTGCRDAKPYRWKTPCFRVEITETRFFRLRPADKSPLETTNMKQIFNVSNASCPSESLRTLVLTQGIGKGTRQELTVHVDKFVPLIGDKTAYEWKEKDGTQRRMKMPAYCLTYLDIAVQNMCLYAQNSTGLFLEEILSKSNDITWDTISMAMRYAAKFNSSIVKFALELWSFSRIIERTWHICGSETLDFDTIKDTTNKWYGIIPVPPIMDTQLDQIVIQCRLVPLSKSLLRQLKYMIENHNRPDTWFEIYLTSFILMTTTESAAIHGKAFAERYGLLTRYPSNEQMEELFHSAKVILAYFHYACNGSAPMNIDWTKKESAKLAKLDDEEVSYMIRTQEKIKNKEKEFKNLCSKNKYEMPLYWGHQLWFHGWKGSVTHIEDEIEDDI